MSKEYLAFPHLTIVVAFGTGDHDDCFRFWEAIKAGAIPVYAKRKWGLRKDGDIKTLLQRFHGGRIKTSESMVSTIVSARFCSLVFCACDERVSRRNLEYWQVEADSDKPFVCPDPMDNVLRTNPPVVVLESWVRFSCFDCNESS